MLARMALALTTRARHGGHTDGVIAHRVGHGGEVGRVRTKTTAGAAGGAVEGQLACSQAHPRMPR